MPGGCVLWDRWLRPDPWEPHRDVGGLERSDQLAMSQTYAGRVPGSLRQRASGHRSQGRRQPPAATDKPHFIVAPSPVFLSVLR